jgi:hypothetical protein
MCFGGGGGGGNTTSTVTQTQQPPQQFLDAYTNLVQRAQSQADQPYPGNYPGPLVAGFTPQQMQAFQTVGNIQGAFTPYLNAAAQEFGQATQPLWPSLPQFDVSGLPSASMSALQNASSYAAGAAQPIGSIVKPFAEAASNVAQSLPAAMQPYQAGAQNVAQALPGQVAGFAGGATSAAASAPGAISSFLSPYTQNVTTALQNLFNQQNAQQQAQVAGSTVGAGAYGGDRQAVVQALTAQQQQLAEAPVLAQTQQQGFMAALNAAQQQATLEAQTGLGAGQLTTQAGLGAGQLGLGAGQLGLQAGLGAAQAETQAGGLLGQALGQQGQLGLGAGQLNLATGQALMQDFAQQQQAQFAAEQGNAWVASQAAFGLAGLGQEEQGLGIAGAQAGLQAGALQQQLGQEQLNIPYGQWIAQQAYPYQQIGFLAPIVEGTGSLAGGTGTTGYPGPSLTSQLGGLGLAGAGLIGATGGFGQEGWLTNMLPSSNPGLTDVFANAGTSAWPMTFRRGGRVVRQMGGGIPGVPPGLGMGGLGIGAGIPNVAASGIIPAMMGGQAGRSPMMASILGAGTTTSTGPAAGGGSSALGGIATTVGTAAAAIRVGQFLGALLFAAKGGRISRSDLEDYHHGTEIAERLGLNLNELGRMAPAELDQYLARLATNLGVTQHEAHQSGGSTGLSGTTEITTPFSDAYNNLLRRAEGLSSQAYPGAYRGSLLAGLTPQQHEGM